MNVKILTFKQNFSLTECSSKWKNYSEKWVNKVLFFLRLKSGKKNSKT